jgi:hypothetical protein
VLGVVNLHSIGIRNPAYSVSEGMVRMGNIGKAAKRPEEGRWSPASMYNLEALVLCFCHKKIDRADQGLKVLSHWSRGFSSGGAAGSSTSIVWFLPSDSTISL